MGFATLNFSIPVSGTQGPLSNNGTLTVAITGNADGSIAGSWNFTGNWSDNRYSAAGATTVSGTLTGSTTGSPSGPWTLDFGPQAVGESVTLAYAGGMYTLGLGMGYAVDFTVTVGYDNEYTYHDVFQFNANASVAGAAPAGVGGTATNGNDALVGTAGDDLLAGLAGNDSLDGAAGTDTAMFTGNRGTYAVAHANPGQTVSGADGVDSIVNFERLRFSDLSVNLTVGAQAHTISTAQLDSLVELYIAYIARVPDADGMAFWIGQLKGGQTLNQLGEAFYAAAVQFSSITGYSASMTNADFVTLVYRNVLGRESPDAEGLAFWSNELATGHSSRGTLVSSMLGSAHSFKGDATFGYVADLLDNKIAVGKAFSINQGLVYNTPEDSIAHGMAIAAAVTPTSTVAAVQLIGVSDGFGLY